MEKTIFLKLENIPYFWLVWLYCFAVAIHFWTFCAQFANFYFTSTCYLTPLIIIFVRNNYISLLRYFWFWSICKFIAKILNLKLWKHWLSIKNWSFAELTIILMLAEAAKTRWNFYAKIISIWLLLPAKTRFQNFVFN